MERHLLAQMGKIAGFQHPEGMFAPGGSMANCYSMLLARHHKFPNFKEDGIVCDKKLAMFVSDQAHYSFRKSAIMLGHGTKSVISVPTDQLGRMIPDELEIQILKAKESHNEVPFMVAATAGTTVFGAFDPLVPIGTICQKYGLWFHVDGALGFSPLHIDTFSMG